MSEIKVNSVVNSTGDNDSGIDLSTNDQVVIKTANTSAITVDSSQRVMIGTTTEGDVNGDDLTIATTGATGITVRSGTSSDGHLFFSDGTSGADEYRGYLQYNHQNDRLSFGTNAVQRMQINSSGDVMIGTSTVDLSAITSGTGTTVTGTGQLLLAHDGNNMAYMNLTNYDGGTENFFVFMSDASTKGSIGFNGSSTSYNTSSDHRLKESVTYDFDATTRLKQLKPCRFNFIADADTTVDGFLAHEVQSVVPEAITGTHNEEDDDGNPVYQQIDQSKIVPLLVKTIQELEARITALENAE